MKRTFDIGDKVVCVRTGVSGIVFQYNTCYCLSSRASSIFLVSSQFKGGTMFKREYGEHIFTILKKKC